MEKIRARFLDLIAHAKSRLASVRLPAMPGGFKLTWPDWKLPEIDAPKAGLRKLSEWKERVRLPQLGSLRQLPEAEKMKNLRALSILLLGLFVGSLLVDVIQLVSRSGFSRHVIEDQNVLESAGKTWVAFGEPRVRLLVVSDSDCAECDPAEALVWLRRLVPTLDVEMVEEDSDLGKALIGRFGLKTLPAFVFGESVDKTSFFTEAEPLFTKEAGFYRFDAAQIGLQAGKYLEAPQITDTDVVVGNPDAPVKIITYTDFQCEYCRDFHATLEKVRAEYGDRVAVVYRMLPLSFDASAPVAAEAALCAHEQGAFSKYADALFLRQSDWINNPNSAWFGSIARSLGLNGKDFLNCLETRAEAERISDAIVSAGEFGILGAPSTFVGTTLLSGAVDYDTLKAAIDAELSKN